MAVINFFPFLKEIPPGTRLLTALLIGGTLTAWTLSAYLEIKHDNDPRSGRFTLKVAPWLVMYPGESYVYPWTLATAGFVEGNIIELIASTATLILATRYLERIWGFVELIRFSFIVVVASNIIAFGYSWLVYLVTGIDSAINGTPYHGLSALQIGYLVAFTQLIPEHQVQILGSLRLRVKTLPGIYLLLSNILIIALSPSPWMLVQFGFFVAWAYLRFFKLSEDGLSRGDRSETFAFQYWFPPLIRPVVSRVANQVFKLAVRVGIVRGWEEGAGYERLPGPAGATGGARAEAERRRALALKALDARVASSNPTAPAGPSNASAASASTANAPAPAASIVSDPAANAAADKATGGESIELDVVGKKPEEKENAKKLKD